MAAAARERPILFLGPMVRAILDGRKSVTRRVMKPQPDHFHDFGKGRIPCGSDDSKTPSCTDEIRCKFGVPGDKLWVKENWAYRKDCDHLNGSQLYERGVRQAWYWADGPGKCCNTGCNGAAGRVRAARFMPRWASRLTLDIVSVRVERLMELTEEDAALEGKEPCVGVGDECLLAGGCGGSRICAFRSSWDSLHGEGSWASTPFVWRIAFKPVGGRT